MNFYRYEIIQYGSTDINGELCSSLFPNIKVYLITLELHKETSKGYWIGYGSIEPGKLSSQSKWVSKTSRKRYAYPTKEEALTNFIKRNERRVEILERQVGVCKSAIYKAKEIEKELLTI